MAVVAQREAGAEAPHEAEDEDGLEARLVDHHLDGLVRCRGSGKKEDEVGAVSTYGVQRWDGIEPMPWLPALALATAYLAGEHGVEVPQHREAQGHIVHVHDAFQRRRKHLQRVGEVPLENLTRGGESEGA